MNNVNGNKLEKESVVGLLHGFVVVVVVHAQ
jgi:hypothetical protein